MFVDKINKFIAAWFIVSNLKGMEDIFSVLIHGMSQKRVFGNINTDKHFLGRITSFE